METKTRIGIFLLILFFLSGITRGREEIFPGVERYRKYRNYRKILSIYQKIILSQPISSPLSRKASLQLLWERKKPALRPLGLYVGKKGDIYVFQKDRVSIYSLSSRLRREYIFSPQLKEKIGSLYKNHTFIKNFQAEEMGRTLLLRTPRLSLLLDRKGKTRKEFIPLFSAEKRKTRMRGGRLEIYSSGRLKCILGEINPWTEYLGEDELGNIYTRNFSSPHIKIFDSWGRYLESLPLSFQHRIVRIWQGNLIILTYHFSSATYSLKVYSPSRFYYYLKDPTYWDRAGDKTWEYYGKGTLYLRKGEIEKALQTLSLISPPYPDPNIPLALANIFRYYGRLNKAGEILHKRAEQFPSIPDVWFDLYIFYQEKGDLPSAHSFLQKSWDIILSKKEKLRAEVVYREMVKFYEDTRYLPYPFPQLKGWRENNLPSYTLSTQIFLDDYLPDFSLVNLRISWDRKGNLYLSTYPLKKVIVLTGEGKLREEIPLPIPPLGTLPAKDGKIWVLTGSPPHFYPLWIKLFTREGREREKIKLPRSYSGGLPRDFILWRGKKGIFILAEENVFLFKEKEKTVSSFPYIRSYHNSRILFSSLPGEDYLYSVGDSPVLFLQSLEKGIRWLTPLEKNIRYHGYPGPLISGECFVYFTPSLKKIIYFSLRTGRKIKEARFTSPTFEKQFKLFLLPDLRIGVVTDTAFLYLYTPHQPGNRD